MLLSRHAKVDESVTTKNPTQQLLGYIEVLQFVAAIQSTTSHGGDAFRAIDGKTDGNYWSR